MKNLKTDKGRENGMSFSSSYLNLCLTDKCHSSALCLNFLICKMRTWIVPTLAELTS